MYTYIHIYTNKTTGVYSVCHYSQNGIQSVHSYFNILRIITCKTVVQCHQLCPGHLAASDLPGRMIPPQLFLFQAVC